MVRSSMTGIIVTVASLLGSGAMPAAGEVDLVFRTESTDLPVGARYTVELYAVSADGTDIGISAADVGFTWDPSVVTLVKGTPGPYPWTMSGFLPDSNLDGINDSLADGDARYTVLASLTAPAVADANGSLLATFVFEAVGASDGTTIAIEPTLGPYSPTRVFGTNAPNENITGTLGSIVLSAGGDASVSVSDVSILAGRRALVVASGKIADQVTGGVTVVITLSPRDGATGTVQFTFAPPTDIQQLGDPWPGTGLFSAFDTDVIPFEPGIANGVADSPDLGAEVPASYDGPLAGFPVVASEDAWGTWDMRLEFYDENAAAMQRSNWEGVTTAMRHGVLIVVEPGDGNGSASIGLEDYSELQACFSGPVGPIEPPAYSQAPELRCGVYDFDGDGDVDADDYRDFSTVMLGPVP